MKRLALVIGSGALLWIGADAWAASGSRPTKNVKKSAAATPPGTVTAPGESAPAASGEDSTYTLKGGQEGTVFKSLTVQGEDRIRFEIARPPLRVDLEPTGAPGLEWGSAKDVLDRTVPDLRTPLVQSTSSEPSPWSAHPWLSSFASGAVARFHPEVKGVERWKLTIVNARAEAVVTYQGRGEPPREIVWDGRSQSGAPVVPGLTYSYVLEAHDKAGNKRNFVGQGFQVSAYRLETPEGPMLTFSGKELPTQDPRRAQTETGTAPIVIEAASWLNQRTVVSRPIRVTATARSADEAQALVHAVARQIAPYLIGDASLIQSRAETRPDAPEGGTIQIVGTK